MVIRAQSARVNISCGRISMTPEIMRQYLAAHAPELEVVELPEAHTTEYISREWKVLPAQVAKTLTLRVGEDAIIVVTCGDSSSGACAARYWRMISGVIEILLTSPGPCPVSRSCRLALRPSRS